METSVMNPRPHFRDISPLLEAVPVAGPPAVLLVGPLVLFALLLAGPVALLATLVVVLALAAALLAALAAIVASPYLLVRHLRARHMAPAADEDPVPDDQPARAPTPTPISLPGF
jgi:hypothetical protein